MKSEKGRRTHGYKIEHAEEVPNRVIIFQGIASYTKVDQSSTSKECREVHCK